MDHEQKLSAPPRDALLAYYRVEDLRREEEIRVVDLWLLLVRRKAVLFTVAGLILAVGLAYALWAPPKYSYSALVELGTVSTDAGPRPVEEVSTALAKTKDAFLPAVLSDYLKTQPEGTRVPEIRVSVPRGSEVISLVAEGTAEEGETLVTLQSAVISRLAQDHANLVDAGRRAVRANIAAAKNDLDKLAAEADALEEQGRRVDELLNTLRQRRSDIARQLGAATALQPSGRDGNDMAASDMPADHSQTDTDAAALHDQLLQIDERVGVELPQSLVDVRLAIESNAREIVAERERVADLESRLAEIRDTRATRPPAPSLEPVGIGGAVVVFLAAGLGLIFGIGFAFLSEGLANARAQLAERGIARAARPGAGLKS